MTSEFRVPAPLQNTIDNLTFLASTDDGEKLFFKDRLHINSTDWLARVRRYYYNETLESQKKIIKEIIDLGLDSLKSYRNNVHYNRLVKEFKKAKDGLSNLRNTYLKEGREVQDLDNYIYVMENQIKALEKEHDEAMTERINRELKREQSDRENSHDSLHFHFKEANESNENDKDNRDDDNDKNTILHMNSLRENQIIENNEAQYTETLNKKSNRKTRSNPISIKNRPELQEFINREKNNENNKF